MSGVSGSDLFRTDGPWSGKVWGDEGFCGEDNRGGAPVEDAPFVPLSPHESDDEGSDSVFRTDSCVLPIVSPKREGADLLERATKITRFSVSFESRPVPSPVGVSKAGSAEISPLLSRRAFGQKKVLPGSEEEAALLSKLKSLVLDISDSAKAEDVPSGSKRKRGGE